MNYLVTGGAGFIGHHLALRLHELGHQVTVLDNFNDYYDPTIKRARVARFPKDITVLELDITNGEELKSLCVENKFDAICHLAAQAGVRYSLSHPEVYMRVNYIGTFNVLEAAKVAGIKKIVAASTSSVYGTSDQQPFVETDPAFMPMSIYAATKRATEFLGATYHHLYGIDMMFLRFFTVYGPWGRPDMSLFLFTKKILAGEPIDVFNHGQMKRAFTYIDDIVSGFVLALEKGQGYEIFNLGSIEAVPLMDFIKTIETVLGREAAINFLPLQAGDVPETVADISKAKALLGYAPKTAVPAGVKNFVTWYRSYYGV